MKGIKVIAAGWFVGTLVAAGSSVGIGHLVERACNRSSPGARSTLFNLACFAPASLLQGVSAPLVAGATVLAVNAGGGGAFALPDRGWGLGLGVIVYTVAMDLAEYAYHRAQHRLPILWSMHSLHHSDASFNASTTLRHFWADRLIKAATVYLLVGLAFRASPLVIGAYAILSYYNYVAHMNVRLGFGRWSWMLNSPQYHRLHHSSRPGDENVNFAALLPIFDVLTGAYRRPIAGDYPPTGLEGEPGPSGVVEAMIWPLRGVLGLCPAKASPASL